MRAPARHLAVDAAVLVATARGSSSAAVLAAAGYASLLTTDRALEEARRRLVLGVKAPELAAILDQLALDMTIYPVAELESFMAAAQTALRDAVSSRNGSMADAHILALAWLVGADIWSGDRDFAGTGVASWSTPNLMRAFTLDSP
jgi:predicted nucleic acid-binding protein